MPLPPFRRKPSAHGPSSLLRFLFPQTRARARTHLSNFRHNFLPTLRHSAQSRIYKYIVYRQARRLTGKESILQRLRGRTRRLIGNNRLENEASLRRQTIARASGSTASGERAMTYQESYAPREAGGRRRKLAGYLKAANELRQTYTDQYAPNWSGKEASYDCEDDTPGTFPDAAVVRSGEEEMILFPSYARTHIKRKPEAQPGTIQEVEGEGRDVRDSTGAGDAEFWKQQWENYEDDNAVVDVDVRGWIYSPHKGQMTRKQRLFIGLARQLVGVSAPPAASNSSSSSRDPSPARHGFRERAHLRDARRDEDLAAREAEQILRKGQKEAEAAAKGAYSERPAKDLEDDTQLYRAESRNSVRTLEKSPHVQKLSRRASNASFDSTENIKPVQKRASWQQPSEMSPAELAEANARLMARLRHFLAIPMANTPISVFFYNDKISKQRTVYTDASGHFSMSAALDFVPTHVRILASDKLSATEEVIVTGSQGISVISDIDDTIKHSAIGSGAREIFRNVFIRDLYDLTIDGVREWYNKMAELGVKFHYVSNSPWQLYPVISKYFSLAGLPPGSFHLKQYSGMLQGIFEPVAERKKVTLDKIARDFPERRFMLIGDSGEADLEVYTDFVLENPGRVVAVFIRDVTTTEGPGFFEPSSGFGSSDGSSPRQGEGRPTSMSGHGRASSEDDPELNAAIAASLRDLEQDNLQRSKSASPRLDQDHPNLRPKLPDRNPSSQTTTPRGRPDAVPNLIDLSSEGEPEDLPILRRVNTDTKLETEGHRSSIISTASLKSAPPPPKKPAALRTSSNDYSLSASSPSRSRPLPPKPLKPSKTVSRPSPLSMQDSAPSDPKASMPPRVPVAPKPNMSNLNQNQDQQSYAGMARGKLWSVYNTLPALRSQVDPSNTSSSSSLDVDNVRKAPPPPPPPRRGNRETATNAASYVGNRASAAWQHAPSMPYHNRPQLASVQTSQPFSTGAPRQTLNRTNTGSTLGGDSYGTKREQLWRQRWAKAEQILKEHGVVLKSWRVGSDVAGDAERIIKEAEKKWKNGRPDSGDKSMSSSGNSGRNGK